LGSRRALNSFTKYLNQQGKLKPHGWFMGVKLLKICCVQLVRPVSKLAGRPAALRNNKNVAKIHTMYMCDVRSLWTVLTDSKQKW